MGILPSLCLPKGMAHPRGFEPLTPRFVVWCSIQLSYGCRLKQASMSHSKIWLQDAEETADLGIEFFEIERFGQEYIATGLEDFLFHFGLAADGNDYGRGRRPGFNAPANFDAIYAGNHDVENEHVWFRTADFEQRANSVGDGGDLESAFPFEIRFHDLGDVVFVIH